MQHLLGHEVSQEFFPLSSPPMQDFKKWQTEYCSQGQHEHINGVAYTVMMLPDH